jgi:type III restriction enzyme
MLGSARRCRTSVRFAEFGDVYQIGSDFEAKVKGEFDKMIERHLTREMA